MILDMFWVGGRHLGGEQILRVETRGSRDMCQLTGRSSMFTFLTLALPLELPLGINIDNEELGPMTAFQRNNSPFIGP